MREEGGWGSQRNERWGKRTDDQGDSKSQLLRFAKIPSSYLKCHDPAKSHFAVLNFAPSDMLQTNREIPFNVTGSTFIYFSLLEKCCCQSRVYQGTRSRE